jgi:O-acetyl-ADP-ribose deacetylase (regulator of RNase III)
MIHNVSGDILLSGAQVIAHGIAANDPMSKGLALSLHQKYPAMHKDFHHWCNREHPKPGEIWMWGGAEGVRVVNMLTQEGGYGHGAHPGKATTKHVRDALKALAKLAAQESFKSIALPKVATGVGGLQWTDVEPLIREQLSSLDIPVYVYVDFHAGKRAVEPAG